MNTHLLLRFFFYYSFVNWIGFGLIWLDGMAWHDTMEEEGLDGFDCPTREERWFGLVGRMDGLVT